MTTTRIDWAAIKVDDESLDKARAFGNALGLAVLVDSSTQLMMQTEDGGVLEFCSSQYEGPAYLFSHSNTVVGFGVTDLVADGAKLSAAGFVAVTDVTDAGPVLFQHYRGPGGQNYGLIQHK